MAVFDRSVVVVVVVELFVVSIIPSVGVEILLLSSSTASTAATEVCAILAVIPAPVDDAAL